MGDTIPFMRLDRQFAEHRDAFMAAIMPVLEGGAVLQGPPVAAFEAQLARFMSAKHAIAVGSGTDAMIIALKALGLEPGARVAVPALTFIASAACILHAGCRPVFIDCDPATGLADPALLLPLVEGGHVDAIIAVHLYGQMQDIDAVARAARARNIPIVEDAAQALGSTRNGQPPGKAGTITAISFDPMKVIGAFGSGGAILTDDDDLARRARQLRYHGHDGKGNYLLPGFNSQIHSLQAAALGVKLDQALAWQERRTRIAAIFDSALAQAPGVRLMSLLPGNVHNFHKYVMWAERRDALRDALNARGVQSKVHYEVPLHRQKLFEAHAVGVACPHAEAASAHVLSLPMYPELTDGEAQRVAATAREILDGFAA